MHSYLKKNKRAFGFGMTSLILFIFFVLTGCGNSISSAPPASNQAQDIIQIVAAEHFYGEVARAVGGRLVRVTSIIDNPSVDPHDFKPTTATAKTVSQADIVIYNGLGYDDWMGKIIGASSNANSKHVIRVADQLMGKKEGDNEHVWYHPKTMPALAKQLAVMLSSIDSAHADTYQVNAQKYVTSLRPISQFIDQLKQSKPVKVDVSEPVFDYMLGAMNYQVNDPDFELSIDEGRDPSPQDLIRIQQDMRLKKIPFFVQNVQNDSPTVQNLVALAKQNNIPVITVTETNPAGKNYVQWMTDQLKQIEQAIGTNR